jgi:hypothetical protein
MSQSLLLDEMFSDTIARQLRAKGHDVISVVADPGLTGLSDDQVLAYATAEGRALVTANIRDFVPLDGRCRAAGQTHAGLILVSTKTFPQNRGFTAAITAAVTTLLSGTAKMEPGQMLFLPRGLAGPQAASGAWRSRAAGAPRTPCRYRVSRIVIDSAGSVMPPATDEAVVVPVMMLESAGFWLPAL